MLRKLTTLVLALIASVLFVAGALAHSGESPPQPAAESGRLLPLPSNIPKLGLVYDGLERPTTGRCKGLFRLKSADVCTHGPDPVSTNAAENAGDAVPVSPATPVSRVQCDGDGFSGNRVQVVYAHAADVPSRYSDLLASIRQAAADADRIFRASAAETGGERHIRFVTDANCNVVVSAVTLTTTGDDNFNNTVRDLQNPHLHGYTLANRKYMIFVDANMLCGQGQVQRDDRADSSNKNNFGPTYGRTDILRCFGGATPAHELMHNLGGVQLSAPHSTGAWHCTDENDRMCTAADGVAVTSVCSDPGHEQMFDCNHDDYFSTNPPSGNYLASHWNSALNQFLVQNRQSLSGWVRTDNATAASSAPLDQANSSGAVNTVFRDSIGDYRIVFPGLGTPGWVKKGAIHVTAYGSTSEFCKVETWTSVLADLIVKVRCFDSFGVPVNTRFLATFTRPVGTVGKFAYVWADKPTTASYIPWAYRQYNGSSSGATNTVARLGTGSYEVKLPNLATVGGTVQVTAYGPSSESCRVISWGPSGSDELVRVSCHTTTGAPVDTQFVVTFADGIGVLGIPGGKGAYLWAHRPTTDSYTPLSAYQWNSAGGVNTITRTGVGAYTARIAGLPFVGHAQVTAFKGSGLKLTGPDARCKVSALRFSYPDRLVDVRCFDLSGAPIDSRFTLGFVA